MTRERDRLQYVLGAGLAVLLSVAATWPLLLEIPRLTRLSDATNDDFIYYWNDWWIYRALFVLHRNPLFCPEIFVPFGHSLAASPLALTGALISLPFQAVLGSLYGAAVTIKLLSFLSFPVAIIGTQFLLRVFGVARGPAFLGGCVYAFAPFRFLHLTRVHYLAGALTPWFLGLLWSSMRSGRRRSLVAAGAVFAAAGAFDASLLIEMGFTALLALGFEIFVAEADAAASRFEGMVVKLRRWILALVAGVVCLSPLLIPLALEIRDNRGIEVSERLHFDYEPQRSQLILSPDLNSLCYYLSPSLHELLFGSGHPLGHAAEPTKNILHSFRPIGRHPRFEGCMAALCAAGLAIAAASSLTRRRTWPFAALAAFGFVLALGPYRQLGDRTVSMPYQWLTHVVPGLAAGRYPAAHLRLFHLGLAVCVGFGIQTWWCGRGPSELQRVLTRARLLGLLAGLLIVGCCVAWWGRPFQFEPLRHEPLYEWITHDPAPGSVIELPPRNEGPRRKMALGQIQHQRPLVNGPLTRVAPKQWKYFTEELRIVPRMLRPPPPRPAGDSGLEAEIADNLEMLERDRVRFIVIRRSLQSWDPTAYFWLEHYLRQHRGLDVRRIDGHIVVRVACW